MQLDSYRSLPNTRYNIPAFYKHLIESYICFNKTKQTQEPKTYYDIRKQIIWGNQNIKLNGKCLVFHNFIKSNILYINDIINDSGEIDPIKIYETLVTKTNWILQVKNIQSAIPRSWKNKLKIEESVKTNVKTERKKNLDYSSKYFYQTLVQCKFEKPYVHTFWERLFGKTIEWASFYYMLNKVLLENKVKEFRFKTIHRIIATNENLFRWKLSNSPLCKFCNQYEDYNHFFIECTRIKPFWQKVTSIFKKCGFSIRMNCLERIVIGYKISMKDYQQVNILLSQIGSCIYRSYYLSERRTEHINIEKLLYGDLYILCKYYERKSEKCVLISKFLNYLQLTI
jgi:hypothetical protein